ncbi:MAG: SRPBCC family protein [Bdellovibrionota bacterium]
MENEVKITRSFSLPQAQLFSYFTDKSLLEHWAFPEGMSLRLPIFEGKTGGRYLYEHTGKNGTYLAEGYFVEVSSNRIVQIDQSIKGPDGKELFENIECQISFVPNGDKTEVQVVQGGFKTQKDADQCKVGWEQSLDHLEALVRSNSGQNQAAS